MNHRPEIPLKAESSFSGRSFDFFNALVGAAVFLLVFIVYYLTKAPTLSFWDCGEFIAAAYTLGVPHPPGSPLYILLGRIFSVLPLAADIAVRINLVSVVSGAGGALFSYLVAVRILRHWFIDRTDLFSRLTIYLGGLTGALFMAFAVTTWSNAVEAEVYGLAMLMMLVIYWLALKYLDSRETPSGSRIMVLVIFLGMLGIGVHLTMFLVVPILGIYFVLKKETGIREWALIGAFLLAELYLIFILSSRPGEVPFYLPILIVFILMLFHATILKNIPRPAMIGMVLFLPALYPFYFIAIEAFARNFLGRDWSGSFQSLKSLPIGWLGLLALSLWGLYCILKLLQKKGFPEERSTWLFPAVYTLIPALLLGIGLIFRGYNAFIFLTVVGIIILAAALWRQINWIVMVALGVVSAVVLGFWSLVIGLIAGSIVIVVLGIYLKDKGWRTALMITLLAATGYSIYVSIPIRSSLNPTIDMNKPSSSLKAMVGYLERKQYGSESMVHRMFTRRGAWENQFGDYPKMGFWGFFKGQYGLNGSRFFIILVLGLFGIWETIRRRPEIGFPFLILLLLSSVGLVLYMNFADGTRIDPVTGEDYLEVRDRDYFFTPAFVLFGLAIGLGVAALVEFVRDFARGMASIVRRSVYVLAAVLVLLPIMPLKANYFINDRSRNYMPYDYAKNFLQTCEKDAIMFNFGDNDTFPMWCLQEVYGYRKDVRIINLSLANMSWYTKQLRDKSGVPISYTDAQLDKLQPYFRGERDIARIQDQIFENVIENTRWRYPIYITVTVPEWARRFKGQPLNDNLRIEGMLYHLVSTKGKNQLDFEKTRRLFMEEYDFRGVNDPTVFKDENARRLIGNYAQGFIALSDSLRTAGDFEGALTYLRAGIKTLPWSFDMYAFGAQVLGYMGKIDTLETFAASAPTDEKWKVYFNYGIAAKLAGRVDESIRVLEMTLQINPDYNEAYRALLMNYYEYQYFRELRKLVADWVSRHPEDSDSRNFLREIQKVDPAADTLQGRRR